MPFRGQPRSLCQADGLFETFFFFNVEAIACATVVTGSIRRMSLLVGLIGISFVVVILIGDAGNTATFGGIARGGSE